MSPAALLPFLLLLVAPVQDVPEYELKAEFLERFILFVDWPEEVDSSHLVIGILGENPFGPYLESRLSHQDKRGRELAVRELTDLGDAATCHVLFVSSSERDVEKIVEATRGRPILTVGDREGLAKKGFLIDLIMVDDRLGFEVNRGAIEESGLTVSSRLLRFAHNLRVDR